MFREGIGTIGDIADPTYSDPIVKRWNQTIKAGDCYLILTAEYLHSVPGELKNALDTVFLSFGFRNKPAAFVGYSTGVAAGVRAVEHLAMVMIETEGFPLRNTVLIPYVHKAFEDGKPRDLATRAALSVMLEDLAWTAKALKAARVDGELAPGGFRQRTKLAELTERG